MAILGRFGLCELLKKRRRISEHVVVEITHIGHKGRLHYSSLQPLEVDVFEERVGLDARCSIHQAPQPLLGVFGQQLCEQQQK